MTQPVKHTPGPWHVGLKPGPMVYGPQGEQIVGLNVMLDSDEVLANAKFIAAAPVMYADLCAVRDYLFELYDEGNAKAGEYAASLGITVEQAEGQHHE